jgi:FkbM family methyltransferase
MSLMKTLRTGGFQDAVRRVIPQSAKDGLASLLCSPLVGESLRKIYQNKIPHRGHRIFVDTPRVAARTVAMIFFQIYERAEVDMVTRLLPDNCDVIELGSSLGVNCCNIASKIRKGTRLVSVEADPELAELARRSVALNGYGHKVTILNAAISYESQTVALVRGADTMSATVTDSVNSGTDASITTLRLRNILEQYAIGDYSLVADIEGAEIGVLLEDRPALERCKAIIIEIEDGIHGEKRYSYEDIRSLILELGFVEAYAYGKVSTFLRRAIS